MISPWKPQTPRVFHNFCPPGWPFRVRRLGCYEGGRVELQFGTGEFKEEVLSIGGAGWPIYGELYNIGYI